MEQIILIAHLIIALAIIALIMLQQGKGADMGASFGAGASQTLFGSDGSGNVLTRATSWLVVLFFASSFSLALLATQNSDRSDDLGLDIPVAVDVPVQAVSEELPVIEIEEFPVIEIEEPAAEAAGSDVPNLD